MSVSQSAKTKMSQLLYRIIAYSLVGLTLQRRSIEYEVHMLLNKVGLDILRHRMCRVVLPLLSWPKMMPMVWLRVGCFEWGTKIGYGRGDQLCRYFHCPHEGVVHPFNDFDRIGVWRQKADLDTTLFSVSHLFIFGIVCINTCITLMLGHWIRGLKVHKKVLVIDMVISGCHALEREVGFFTLF